MPYVHSSALPNTVHPRFYRLRNIMVANGKFMSCSCGLPVRMRYLCRHIMCLLGGYSKPMFAVRWNIFYQHTFERRGNEESTAIYREIESEQFSRDSKKGEDILVTGCDRFNTLQAMVVEDKPALLEGTSILDLETMMYIDTCVQDGCPVIRSNNININDIKDDSKMNKNADDSEITVQLSQQTKIMFENDDAFENIIQESQLQDMQLEQSTGDVCNKDYKDQTAVAMIRDCLKIAEDDDEMYDKMIADLVKMQQDMTDMALNKKQKETEGLHFGHTGKSKKTRDKRKGHY